MRSRGLAVAVVALTMMGLTACSGAGGGTGGAGAGGGAAAVTSFDNAPQGIKARGTLDQFCGKGTVKVAYIDGFGGNTWRKTTLAELQDEASKCPNVELKYFNANGDQATYISQVNAATAQNYNALITYDDFGQAVLPALKQAHAAGVAVVPFAASPGGTPGVDYTGFVSDDVTAAPKA